MNIRRALGISAVAQFVTFIVSFATVIIISRILTPEEVGIFSVSAALLTFAHIFREFGVGHYLVQIPEVDREKLRAAFSVTLGISWSISLILYVVRAPVSAFYGGAGIADVLLLISINFVLLPFGSPLMSLLRRELQFGKLAIVNIGNSIVSSTFTVGTALAGESYLSMAWGSIGGIVFNIVALNIMRRGEIFMLPTWKGTAEVLKFGSMSSAYSVMGELASNAPDLILGRTLGFSAVAYYSRANGLQKMALFHVTTLVRGVYFPSFAQKIRNGHDAAQLYSRAMAYIVAVTAPALAMLALLAEPLILVLFGPQWERAAPLASILCAFSLLATPTSMAPSSLIATGQMALLARTQFAALCARIAALSSSLFLELEHTVMLVGLSTLLSALLYLRAMRIAFGLHLVEYWSEIRSAASLVPMTLALPSLLYSAEYLFQPGSHPGLLILGSAFGGATGWLFGIRLTNHPIKTELNGLVQRVRIR